MTQNPSTSHHAASPLGRTCPSGRHAVPSPAALIASAPLQAKRFRVCVIGDARIDIRATLHRKRFVDLWRDHHETTSISLRIGGTAMGFAEAAVSHFAEVSVVAAVGNDGWTGQIEQRCRQIGAVPCLEPMTDMANGVVLVVRDAGQTERSAGTRLLVAQSPSPYDRLTRHLVGRYDATIATVDALVVDGYALLNAGSAAAVDLAMGIAHDAGVPISLDVVPHRIDEYVTMERLAPWLRRASLVTIEAPTLARLMGDRVRGDGYDDHDAVALVHRLPEDLAGPRRTWFVRFGAGNTDRTVAVSPGHHETAYSTGYAAVTDPTGYGYVIAAAELKWWLTNATSAPGMREVTERLGRVNVSADLVTSTPGRSA